MRFWIHFKITSLLSSTEVSPQFTACCISVLWSEADSIFALFLFSPLRISLLLLLLVFFTFLIEASCQTSYLLVLCCFVRSLSGYTWCGCKSWYFISCLCWWLMDLVQCVSLYLLHFTPLYFEGFDIRCRTCCFTSCSVFRDWIQPKLLTGWKETAPEDHPQAWGSHSPTTCLQNPNRRCLHTLRRALSETQPEVTTLWLQTLKKPGSVRPLQRWRWSTASEPSVTSRTGEFSVCEQAEVTSEKPTGFVLSRWLKCSDLIGRWASMEQTRSEFIETSFFKNFFTLTATFLSSY